MKAFENNKKYDKTLQSCFMVKIKIFVLQKNEFLMHWII